jgi:hypothetical protein
MVYGTMNPLRWRRLIQSISPASWFGQHLGGSSVGGHRGSSQHRRCPSSCASAAALSQLLCTARTGGRAERPLDRPTAVPSGRFSRPASRSCT